MHYPRHEYDVIKQSNVYMAVCSQAILELQLVTLRLDIEAVLEQNAHIKPPCLDVRHPLTVGASWQASI